MENPTNVKLQKIVLVVVAIGLFPIALSYGLMPAESLEYLFQIEVTSINLENIMRAVMGLYLALIVFWLLGVMKSRYREAAIYSMITFMYGLAAGRILNLIIDGMPNWLLITYLFLELTLGTIGLALVRKS